MLIVPASIIDPFGYTGVPVIFDTSKAAAIIKELDDIFWAMTFSGEIYDMDKNNAMERLKDLCNGARIIATMSGAANISVLPVTLQKDGKIVGINLIVEFTTNGKRHKHNLRDRNGV
jgi:hypothetical protein